MIFSIIKRIILIFILIISSPIQVIHPSKIINCSAILEGVYAQLKNNSIIPYVKALKEPQLWLEKGYMSAKEKARNLESQDACTSLISRYIKHFNQPHLFINRFPFKKSRDRNNDLFQVKKINHKAIYIKLSSFQPKSARDKKKLISIIKMMPKLRHHKLIIFDIRNNPGGYSKYYRQLVKQLWGVQYLRGLGKAFLWNRPWHQIWRTSTNNIYAIKKQDKHFAATLLKEKRKGQAIFHERWWVIPKKGGKTLQNPVSAEIIILTNPHIYSSAWMFLRVLLQLPNTIQMGEKTAVNGFYSEPRSVNFQGFKLTFPMGANLQPNDHLGKPFRPSMNI